MADTAILDVDGTLVDTNYQHALAWFRAFARYDIPLPLWRIHRQIGMGGDQLVQALAGASTEEQHGDDLREAWTHEFDAMIDEIKPFAGADRLLAELKRRGFRVVLASSGKPKHVERFLDLIGGREHADAWTTADDVEETKPAPDLMQVALSKVEGASGVAVGDSTWDFVAAAKLDLPSIAVRTGGFSAQELRDAGAGMVFDSIPDLIDELDATPLAKPS